MMSIEKIENSPNNDFQKRIFDQLDSIETAREEYKSVIKNIKNPYKEKIAELERKINQDKVTIETFHSARKDKIKSINKKAETDKKNNLLDKKLELEAAKEHQRLHLLKIETVYRKLHKDNIYKIQKGDKKAEIEDIKLEKDFLKYYSQEKSISQKQEENDIRIINAKFEANQNAIETKRLELLAEVEENFNINEFKEKKKELKKRISKNKDVCRKLRSEMKAELKSSKDMIENAKSRYSLIKRKAQENIKNIKDERNDYLSNISKEEKDEFRSVQKYINQKSRSRKLRKIDQKERGFFKNINTAYVYIGPAVLGVLFFTVLPFIFMIIASFFKLNLTKLSASRFVGFNNFITTFSRDVEFQKALYNTLIYALVTVILLSVVTIAMAAWLAKNTRIHNFTQTMIFTPHIASFVAISILWIAMLNPNGIINQALALFGIEGPGWLIQENTSLIAVSFVTVWKDIGYYVLIIISGLQSIPAYVYEAAKLDKAKKSTAFFKLTIPLLMPTLSFVFITKFIGSFKVFAPIEIMTNGGPMGSSMVLSYWIYKVGRIGYNYGTAMVGAIILTILIGFFTFLNHRYFKKQIKY